MSIDQILTDPTIITIIASILTVIVGLVARNFKVKLNHFRNFVDSLDTAMFDNKISNEEFDKIYKNGRILLGLK